MLLKVNRKTIDNWENGRTYPRGALGAIADVLGIDGNGQIIDGSRPEPVGPGAEDGYVTEGGPKETTGESGSEVLKAIYEMREDINAMNRRLAELERRPNERP